MFPRRWPKTSEIHRDLLGPVKMASVISTSNQVSGTRAHKLLLIREYQQRWSLWPGLKYKSDMYHLWTIFTYFLYSRLKHYLWALAREWHWPTFLTQWESGVILFLFVFCRDAEPVLQIRNISKATGQLLLHTRRAETDMVWTTKSHRGWMDGEKTHGRIR